MFHIVTELRKKGYTENEKVTWKWIFCPNCIDIVSIMRWEIKNRRNLTTLEKENVIVNHSRRKYKSTSKKKKNSEQKNWKKETSL